MVNQTHENECFRVLVLEVITCFRGSEEEEFAGRRGVCSGRRGVRGWKKRSAGLEEEECGTGRRGVRDWKKRSAGRSLKRSLSPFCQRHPGFDGRKKSTP